MGVPGRTMGVMFTPLTVKYAYYDTERIGGEWPSRSSSKVFGIFRGRKLLSNKDGRLGWVKQEPVI